MNYITQLNQVINYIEEHMTEKISYDELAKIVCCSTYHFQRMFAFMNDVPLSKYIRRRRMSLAAVDLQNGEKIIDVAFKYQYASPTAFSRAFQNTHDILPSEVKKEGAKLKSYPPLSFDLTIRGADELTYRVEEKGAFRIIGYSKYLDREMENNFKTVPDFWDNAVENGIVSELLGLNNCEPHELLGITACGNRKIWKYYIAVSSSLPLNEKYEEYIIPASMWAVFSGEGTNITLQDLERRIVTEWLPFSGYDYGDAPDIERYFLADPQHAKYEFWLSIKNRKGVSA
ncbi:MAG: helix-turn-helix domain-containing protein [Hespellia sp.]|nr:helix-turn-helix domain-containing protein [Hespellia sp.]